MLLLLPMDDPEMYFTTLHSCSLDTVDIVIIDIVIVVVVVIILQANNTIIVIGIYPKVITSLSILTSMYYIYAEVLPIEYQQEEIVPIEYHHIEGNVLFKLLHTHLSHLISLSLIVIAILFGITGLLLSLFSCELHLNDDLQMYNAKVAIRYILIILTGIMIIELLLKSISIGILRFFNNIWHVFDFIILIVVILVESILSESIIDNATSLLITLRLVKIVKLLCGIGSFNRRSLVNAEEEIQVLKSKVIDLECRIDYESKWNDSFQL